MRPFIRLILLGFIAFLPWSKCEAQANIIRSEYFFDTDPGFGNGITIPITASPDISNMSVAADMTNLPVGLHNFFIRSLDANGKWSVTIRFTFIKVGATVAPNIVRSEYFFDTDPGYGHGINIPVTASPNISNKSFAADISALSNNLHTLYVRSLDANGIWSVTNLFNFIKVNTATSLPNIVRTEYFFDADPGFGNGINLPVTSSPNIADAAAAIDITALSTGANHKLFMRSLDATGRWSVTNTFEFYKQITSGLSNNTVAPPPVPNIAKVEYYIDTDPGLGNATNYTITPGTNLADQLLNINPGPLTTGVHTIGIRSQDANGAWSLDNKWTFFKPYGTGSNINPPPPVPNITKVEYYFDNDPGLGNAINYPVTPGTDLADLLINIDPATLTSGVHTLGIRGRDANGAWSLDNKWIFYKPYPGGSVITAAPPVPNITKVEYYIDGDPGLGNATNYTVTPSTNLSDLTVELDPSLLNSGVHVFGIRAKDANGAWGLDNRWIFFKPFNAGGNINPPPAIPNLVQIEYFIDTDPGMGNGIQVSFTPGMDLANLTLNADITGLAVGNHKIGVRAKDANGSWSLVNNWDFVIPNVTVSPNILAYGLKAVNSTTTLNAVLNNNGLPGQSVTSITLNPPFSTTYTPGAIPTTGTVTIPVDFHPTSLLAYQDTMYINTTSGVFKVALSGSAEPVNPQWTVYPGAFDYGNRPVGSNTDYYFTVTNTGNVPLTAGSYTSTNPAFAVTLSNTSIPVGQSVSAKVTYSPSGIATYNGTIKLVNTSNTSDTLFIQVTGTGYVPGTPPVLSFPASAPYAGGTGVNPSVGPAGVYTYSIKYTSANNLPPASGYPKVGIDFNADGDFIDPGEGVYTMTKLGNTSNWSVGESFVFSTNLPLGSNYRYKFFANDSLGNIATTNNVSLNVGPLVTTQTLDLSIYADDITFSTPNPAVGQNFTVTAVLHNNSPYAASNVPIRFDKDSVYITSGVIPYIAPNSTATITQTLSFSPDGFYPIKVWIDSANTLGEILTLNNYAIRPIIVGNFSIPGEILVSSNTTTYTCNNRVYISGTALYNGLNLVGNPPVLGATVTVNVPGVGILTTNTITGGFWSVYYNPSNGGSPFSCGRSYNYTVTVTDYTLTKTINGTPFSFPCVICSSGSPSPYYYYTASNTCPINNASFTETFSLVNGSAPSYKDTVRVYADNAFAYTYSRDSIGLGTTATFTSSFTRTTGLHTFTYVHKYTNTLNGTSFDSTAYNVNVYVEPDLPDLSWYAPGFQTGPRSFAISLLNYPCVPAGASKVFLYDSMPGNPNYALIDSFAIPPIAANGGFPINYTRNSWVVGYHYLKLVADAHAEVPERDETNNIYLGLVYVPFPELNGVITGVSNPAIGSGTVVNFTGKIYNNGADAANFKVQFFVDSIPLGNKISLAGLAGNSSVDVVSPLYTAPQDSCPHTIMLITDIDNEVAELNETNNTSTYTLGIDILEPVGYPYIGTTSGNPFYFQKDVAANFYGFAWNRGTRNAANVRMKFTYNGNVLGYDFMSSLNAGQVKQTGLFNYTFTSPGLKVIRVDYDYLNELCEYDETNNVGYIYVYVNQDLPNLRILSQHISPSLLNPNPGQTVNVVASVFNTGTGAAAPTKMRFYYNDGPGYVQLGNDVQINALLPGKDTTVAATATFAPGSVGLKIIKVKVDALDEITESSEVDNEATRSIVAGAAPDFASSLHEGVTFAPTGFTPGDSVTVKDYIRNYGGASGTAWMKIYIKDEFHNVVSVDSVLFTINGVDSALVSKKMKINVVKGYMVTEIVNSNPPEFNTLNNMDSVMFTAIYALPVSTTINGNLDMTQPNPAFPDWVGGRLILGDADLTITGSLLNADSLHFVITNGNGRLRIVNNNPLKDFPVGTALNSPTFLSINNSGTPDNFSVSVHDSVINNLGLALLTGLVNKTWNIEEDNPGGSTATVTVHWRGSDELPGFSRLISYITHFINNGWDVIPTSPATGNDPYSQTRPNVTSFSPFSVASPSVFNLCPGNNVGLPAGASGTTYQWQVNTGSGFVNITDGAKYSGTGTANVTLVALPTSYYGYQYRCMVDGTPSVVYTIKFVSTWTGSSNTDWFNTGNWSCGVIPDDKTDAIIPQGKANYPVLTSDASVGSLNAQAGATVTITTGANLSIKK